MNKYKSHTHTFFSILTNIIMWPQKREKNYDTRPLNQNGVAYETESISVLMIEGFIWKVCTWSWLNTLQFSNKDIGKCRAGSVSLVPIPNESVTSPSLEERPVYALWKGKLPVRITQGRLRCLLSGYLGWISAWRSVGTPAALLGMRDTG